MANLLILEDQESVYQLMNIVFGDMFKYNITRVTNGQEGLEVLAKMNPKPDVILCDYNMPGMCGDEFLYQLRSNPEFSQKSIVIGTGDFPLDRQGGLAGNFPKPHNLSTYTEIDNLINERLKKT